MVLSHQFKELGHVVQTHRPGFIQSDDQAPGQLALSRRISQQFGQCDCFQMIFAERIGSGSGRGAEDRSKARVLNARDNSIRVVLLPEPAYSEKISDPNYDSQIPEYIYPNLIAYPTGKTSGIAGVIQTAQTPYPWQVTNFVKPNPNNMVVYELLIRDFTSNKNIKTVTDTIAYLKRLGVNAIELMPFSQFDGNDSWGYNPSFYFAPAKAYGTRDDYKQFIDICHQNGIAVIQDMVLDFSTGNSPLVQMYYSNGNPTPQNPWYDVASPNTSYVYGNVFNHNSPYTRALTDSITSFWMNEYKIDGFRFDLSRGGQIHLVKVLLTISHELITSNW